MDEALAARRSRLGARVDAGRWAAGLGAVLGSVAVGAIAARSGHGASLLLAALVIAIGAMVVQQHVFAVFAGWVALEALAYPFIRYPLHHDLATFDRLTILVLGAALLLTPWPAMATWSRRVAITFGLFVVLFGLRAFLTDPLPLAPGQLASSSLQPELDWLQNVALPFVVFMIAARTVTAERWAALAKGLAFLGATLALLALVQWALGFDFSTFSGFAQFEDRAAGAVRAGGPYPTPSALGAVMVVCLAATLYWMQSEKAWVLGGGVFALEVIGLAPTLTKTVWGAAFVTIILALGLRQRISSRTALVAFYSVLAVAVVYTFVQHSAVVTERVSSQGAQDNFSGRLATWRQAVSIFEQWPVSGAGVDQFIGAQHQVPLAFVNNAPPATSAHNTLVSVLGETGLMGFIPLLLLIGAIAGLVRAYRRRARTSEEVLFGATAVAAIVGYVLLSQTFTELYDPPATIFFALVVGSVAGRLNAAGAQVPSSATRSFGRVPSTSRSDDRVERR